MKQYFQEFISEKYYAAQFLRPLKKPPLSVKDNFPAINAPPYYSLQPQIRFTDPDFLFILPFYDHGC